jgi:hypothetical protein
MGVNTLVASRLMSQVGTRMLLVTVWGCHVAVLLRGSSPLWLSVCRGECVCAQQRAYVHGGQQLGGVKPHAGVANPTPELIGYPN